MVTSLITRLLMAQGSWSSDTNQQQLWNASLHDYEPNFGTSTDLDFEFRGWNAEQICTLVKEFLCHASSLQELRLGYNQLDLRACETLSQASMVGCRGGSQSAGWT